MAYVLQRAEQFLQILNNTIEQKKVKIPAIEMSESRDGSAGWKPYIENSYWGKNDSWYRFRTKFVIPKEYEKETVKCWLNIGREGERNLLNPQFLVYINGEVTQALDTNHIDFCLSREAKAGEEFAIELECYAGREYDNVRFQDHPLQFSLYAYCHEQNSEDLFYDIKAAKMAAEIYSEKDYTRILIEEYLTTVLNMLDCRVLSSEAYFASVKAAHGYMQKEFYGKVCGHETVIANCVGHTHIDVAWLWRLEQTRAKAVRSFATELALLEEYPEHSFTSSQPQLYQFVKEDCPEIYEKIKESVKEGRWEVEGAMWLEADCNLSSGESLIRQILHGKRFMKEEFGVDSKVLWLPDVFGYSAALPQILKKTGVDTFVTSKIHWNDTNHFPYDTFLWKGIDGSEIFTQFITASEPHVKLGDDNTFSTYNAQIYPIAIAKGWEIYQQKNINNEMLVSFGHGDGGGGVTREMLEMNRRMEKGIPGVPRTRITTVADAIARIKNKVKEKKIPKWFGELYLEFHRGTYTSIAQNKKYNRKAEYLLQNAEAVALTDKILLGEEYPKQELYDSWTTVLLNQFHDIIPGSSIFEVYEDSKKQYTELFTTNQELFAKKIHDLAEKVCEEGIFVYNPAGISQSGIVTCEGRKYYVKDVPAFGWKVISPEEETSDFSQNDNAMKVTANHMENDFFSLDLDAKGAFTGIYDKVNKRQVLTNGQRGNVLLAFDDHPYQYDNWELSCYYNEKVWEIDEVEDVQIVENDNLSASLRISRKFLNSTIDQIITIYKDIPRIDFDTTIDWHEEHLFLKTSFPVDILSDKATYEIQYGAVERPTHRNTSWDEAKFEVCAHKWADFGEAGYGVALLNDCKYGYDIHDGEMRLSLLKCGTYPNPHADKGMHQFKYSLMPHAGSWRDANVANEAYAFNCPLMAVKTEGKGTLESEYSFVSADNSNIFFTVAKEACDGEDVILRAYESQGKRTNAAIRCGFEISTVAEVDMLEQERYQEYAIEENSFTTEFKPYEIKTFRITKTI